MDALIRVAVFLASMVILGVLLFLAFKFFMVLVVLGLGIAALMWLRNFLVAKEILNANPGQESRRSQNQVIDADYEHVDESSPASSEDSDNTPKS